MKVTAHRIQLPGRSVVLVRDRNNHMIFQVTLCGGTVFVGEAEEMVTKGSEVLSLNPREDSLTLLCQKYGLPVIDLSEFTSQADVISLIPAAFAKQWQLIPLSRVGCVLTICVANPLAALHAIDGVRFATGLRVEVVVAPATDVADVITRFYGVDEPSTEVEVNNFVKTENAYTESHAHSFDVRSRLYQQAALGSPHVHSARVARMSGHYAYVVEEPLESMSDLFAAALKYLEGK